MTVSSAFRPPLPLSFLWACLLFWAVGLGVVGLTDKAELHLWLNQWHAPAADGAMRLLTHLGDGLALAVAALALLLWNRRALLGLVFGVGLGILPTVALKRLLDTPRPRLYFEELGRLQELPLVEGLRLHDHLSMPSGHTATAFLLAGFALAWPLARGVGWQLALFALALLVAFTRVYLSQHFLEDVLAGSVLGVGGALGGAWLAALPRFDKLGPSGHSTLPSPTP